MQGAEEETLIQLIRSSMLEGQDGIKMRAFLAFNRGNALATADNLEILKGKGSIQIHDDTIYPIDSL